VEKVLAVGPSSVKVNVRVWVEELQVVPIPPQLELTNVGRITYAGLPHPPKPLLPNSK